MINELTEEEKKTLKTKRVTMTKKIDEDTLRRAKTMADVMNDLSNGIVTEKQALYFILYKGGGEDGVSFVNENYRAKDLAEEFNIAESTVYSNVSRAEKNFRGASRLVRLMEEKPWWSTVIE